MLIRVKNVIALDNYELEIEFTNQEVRIMDMKPFLNLPIYEELKSISEFRKVKVNFSTIEWENGADFDPESLYNLSHELIREIN